MNIRALIAEDEVILSLTLQKMLEKLWPELVLCSVVENGVEAVREALQHAPDILFLDIKMPGKTGLEVAQELAEEWPENRPFPLIVYVTAYDEFAIQAFEHSASDYVLKPVSEERLSKTVQRLQMRLTDQSQSGTELERVLEQLRHMMPGHVHASGSVVHKPLHMIRAAVGNQIRMIPVEDVLYFEATDKYINVVTKEHSSLIRSSLRELLPQIDSDVFWQIHRSTVVNSKKILAAHKDDNGKMTLKLRDSDDKLTVSRVYSHLFRQM
ncbi:response regulator transcription factor [Undibacterium sp. FT147W]|uniref:Response regulator transcription factor n=1 Tax=Undibacterium rivi TaxID=2828729 RepID=A0ABS5H2D6_9BURK|nr:LytTR family DNA-binding domain-containing protein [Undibacterium rivi]MBR7792886.1 response regulator transcription factor [Undibacterium rivi]